MELYSSLAQRLENQHTTIRQIVEETAPERILRIPQPGKWNIHDQVTHLARYQPVFMQRIDAILKEDSPAFQRYLAENDPEFESWRRMEFSALLNQLDHDRKYMYERITDLSGPELRRTGHHPKFGEMNIVQWSEFFALHEAHHIFSIFQLAKEINPPVL